MGINEWVLSSVMKICTVYEKVKKKKSNDLTYELIYKYKESLCLIQLQFVAVGPGKQVAVGTGEFEDIDCG